MEDNEFGFYAETFEGLWRAEDYLRESLKLKAKARKLAIQITRDRALIDSFIGMLDKKEYRAAQIELGIQEALYVETMKEAARMHMQYLAVLKENDVLVRLYQEPSTNPILETPIQSSY